jgi:HEAT repeat protein
MKYLCKRLIVSCQCMTLLAALVLLATGAGAVSVSSAPASLPGISAPAAAAPAPQAQPARPAADAGQAALGRQALAFLAGRAADPDPDVRAAVAAAWGGIGNSAPKVIELLKKAAKDRDDFVRIEAATSLFRLGDEGGRRVLMDLVRSSAPAKGPQTPAQEMKSFSHTKARAQALVRLADMASEEAVSLMEQTLADGSGAVRDATAVALCRLDLAAEPPVAPFVSQFLAAAKNKDETVRAAAVKALGQTGISSAREVLAAAAKDPSAAVRAEAVAALAATEEEGLAALYIESLQDESLRVRYLAAGGLARIPLEPSAAGALRKLAADDKTPHLALRAMTGLAARGEKVSLDLAERQLRANDIDGRLLALEVIAAAPGAEAVSLLGQSMASDPAMRVRVAAAAALVNRLRKGPS